MLDDMPRSQGGALVAHPEGAIAELDAPRGKRGLLRAERNARPARLKVVRPSALGMFLRPIGMAIGVVNHGAWAMQDVLDQRSTGQNRHDAFGEPDLPLPAAGCLVLEDHAGYPIECPLCGRADAWRIEREPASSHTGAFVCRHAVPDGHGGQVRLRAVVRADEVGGYLDPVTLLSAAA